MRTQPARDERAVDVLASTRLLPLCALLGVATFVVNLVALHLLQRGLDPAGTAVSHYVDGAAGWLLQVGLGALGLGSMALVLGVHRALRQTHRAPFYCGLGLLGTWSVALLFTIAPADPPAGQPTTLGTTHVVAASVAFTVLPLAAVALSAVRHGGVASGSVRGAAAASVVGVAALALTSTGFAGTWQVFGLVERFAIAANLVWITRVALAARPGSGSPA